MLQSHLPAGDRKLGVSVGSHRCECSNNGSHWPNNPYTQTHWSPVIYTMYLRCVSGCRPDNHYHHAMGTFLNPKTDALLYYFTRKKNQNIYFPESFRVLNLRLSIFVPCVFKNNFSKMSQRLSAKTVLFLAFLAFLEICYNQLSIIL